MNLSEKKSYVGRRVAVVCGLSLLVAGGNAALNPHRPAWSAEAPSAGEMVLATALAAKSVLWIDARGVKEYTAGRIQDAVLLNEDTWNDRLPAVLERWQPGQTVVVYCSSRQCQSSHEVARRLRTETGLENVFVLKGGWETWLARKL